MNWILPTGKPINFGGLSQPIVIKHGLGSGTQGQVYEAHYCGEDVAVKWYFPSCIERDPSLKQRLIESIRATSPNESFLWPMALLYSKDTFLSMPHNSSGSFGYMMPLRPNGFIGVYEHLGSNLDISVQKILCSCLNLSEAFHQLHLKGLCYKDISIGNLFFNPTNGHILICDNDNVDIEGRDLGNVLGTPGFMAPEIIMRKAKPGSNSDLFSLAVLLFRLLTKHDPLKGLLELKIKCMDEPARRRLYGEDPVYIFNPEDDRNRPDPIEHSAILSTWPIYPNIIKDLFNQTFSTGMNKPELRALTGQWNKSIATTLNYRRTCIKCYQENFQDPNFSYSCWACGLKLETPIIFKTPYASVVACEYNELHIHHLDPTACISIKSPIAVVVGHPSDKSVLGIQNLSPYAWKVLSKKGDTIQLNPQKSCNLKILQRLLTHAGPFEILKN